MATTSRAWSSMWRIGTESSRRDIHVLRFGQDFIPKILAPLLRRPEVDPAAEDLCELLLDVEESEAEPCARLELDEHVDIAVGPEVIAQDGTEQGETPNVTSAAKLGEAFTRNVD